VPAAKESPDHSSLSRIRERLPFELHLEVFAWILKLADEKKLLARTRRFPTTNGSVRRTPTAASPA
jgi:hypothetical protein